MQIHNNHGFPNSRVQSEMETIKWDGESNS